MADGFDAGRIGRAVHDAVMRDLKSVALTHYEVAQRAGQVAIDEATREYQAVLAGQSGEPNAADEVTA